MKKPLESRADGYICSDSAIGVNFSRLHKRSPGHGRGSFCLHAFEVPRTCSALRLHEVECANQIALQIAAMHNRIQESLFQ